MIVMRNIIVIAYQLNPYAGSECAVAWDYIKHMSEYHKLTVLYGSSGEHHEIGNTIEMENYAAEHPMKNVVFIPVKPSVESKWWDYSLKGIHEFYKEYRHWHDDVFKVVTKLINTAHYDIVHFLGPIGYHEPGRLYQLPVPYIWGPIGGMAVTPASVMLVSSAKYGLLRGGIKLIVKSCACLWRLNNNARVKRALREADVVVCATTEYVRDVEKAIGGRHHSSICYLPENCIDKFYDLNYSKFESERINLIFIGRLDEGKAPFIILEALNKVPRKNCLHVDFLGKGPLLEKAKHYVEKHGLSNTVEFHGNVKREQVFHFLENAHLMLLPTLYDANTTVIWEAMAHAVPTLCLDHCGMHDTVIDGTGIKISVSTYKKIVNTLSIQIQDIIDHPNRLKTMTECLLEHRKKYTWEKRRAEFESFYSLAEEQFMKRSSEQFK